MRLIKQNIAVLVLLLGMAACEIDNPIEQNSYSKPVVEAFISAEDSLIRVNITEMIPYLGDAEDTIAKPLTGLAVYLIKNDARFLLTEQASEPGNYFISCNSIKAPLSLLF